MTVFGFLSVAPVRTGSMAAEVASAVAALEEFPVSYETTPMGTVIEAEDVGDLLDAVEAAHRAVDADRVSTFLKTFVTTFGTISKKPKGVEGPSPV